MIIFLYGPDTYRSRQKLNEIIESYKKIHKSGLDLKHLDLKEKNFEDFKRELQVSSIFAERKLLILENAFANQNFEENFLKDAENFVNTKEVILFYEQEEIKGKDSLFNNFLKKCAKSQEFELLEEEKLKNWVKKEFEHYQAKIEPEALQKLIDYVSNNLWQMANEIKKLVNYKKNQKIEVKDVELLVKPKIETDIFKTIDAIAYKDKKKALELIHEHLEKGDSPLYLFSMINFQFRNLLEIKDLVERNTPYYLIPKISCLHPFIVKKSYQQIKRFTLPQLKKIYQKIFEIDVNIKTGKIEPQTALDLLIAEI